MGVNVSEVFGQNVFDESVMKNRYRKHRCTGYEGMGC